MRREALAVRLVARRRIDRCGQLLDYTPCVSRPSERCRSSPPDRDRRLGGRHRQVDRGRRWRLSGREKEWRAPPPTHATSPGSAARLTPTTIARTRFSRWRTLASATPTRCTATSSSTPCATIECARCAPVTPQNASVVSSHPVPLAPTRHEDDDHRPAGRVVADETRFRALHNRPQIGGDRLRRPHELREARVGKPGESPDDARRHERSGEIAGRHVEALGVLRTEPGHGEAQHERPMKGANKWIPDADHRTPARRLSFRRLRRCRACRASPR